VKLLSILKTTLINEVSDKVKKLLLNKWSNTTQDTPEMIVSNIDAFDKIKSGLPADKRDIMKYSYDELKSALAEKQSGKTIDDIFTHFKKGGEMKGVENTVLKKYIKRFLEIESLLPAGKKDITKYAFLDLVKMIDDVYPKLITKKLGEKFKSENTNLTPDQILFYISTYMDILNEIPADTKRVDEMSFAEFEHLIDSINSKKEVGTSSKADMSDIDLKYDENNLKIFAPKTKDQCIKLKNGRGWCTSREGEGNMYYTYRLTHERTLYYVIDEDKDFNDLNFAVVILVDPDGKTSMADKSNSGRFGGMTNMPWSEIVAKVPKLENLESIFVPEPLTKEERDLISKVERARVGDNPMESFNSPQEVEMWLEYKSPRLSDVQYSNLTVKLKKKYVSLGMNLSSDMIQQSEPEVLKYYISKKIDTIKATNLDKLSSSDISLLNTPILKGLKKELKPKFASELSSNSGKKVEVEYPNGPIPKFAALYGLDDLFDSLPDNLENFLFNNKSGDNINLVVPPSIGRFTKLEAIMMTSCVSELPDEIGLLKNLTFLSLPNNTNLKSLPKSILTLPNIKFIMLNGTNAKVPEGFSNMFAEAQPGSGFFARIIN
jgi:hypothetical protein